MGGNGGDGLAARRAAVVATAVSQLGVREVGFNAGPDVEKYLRLVGSPPRSAWCSCFVSWCLRGGGVFTARFGRARDWFDKRHIVWARGRGAAPQPGDVVGYEWDAGHVSHVELLEQWGAGPTPVTIGGNTRGAGRSREGDGVFRCWRDKRQITYAADVIANPKY